MSIGSWQRSTPGATSVTSSAGGSCSWRRGRSLHPRDATADRPQSDEFEPNNVVLASRQGAMAPQMDASSAVAQRTSSRILPTLASASITRWASATSLEREAAVDHRAQDAVAEEREHLVGEAPADRDPLLDRATAQDRSDPVHPLGQQQADVDGGRGAAEQTDLDDAALRSHRGEVAVGLLAADHVEHDVDAVRAPVLGEPFAQRGRPVGRGPFEDQIGAELPAGLDLARRAGRPRYALRSP